MRVATDEELVGRASRQKKERRDLAAAEYASPTLDGATERLRASIAKAHARGFSAADTLLRCWHDASGERRRGARALAGYTTSRYVDGAADGVFMALQSRATTTFEATIELCRRGFAQEALVLVRTLFETMVDAYWLTANPQLAVTREADHRRHGEYLRQVRDRRLLIRYVPSLAEKLPEVPQPEGIKRMERVFGRGGDRSWTGRNLVARVEDMAARIGDSAATLWTYFELMHPVSNAVAHTTSMSLALTVSGHDEDGGALFGYGPSEEYVVLSLHLANWCYGMTLSLFFEHLEVTTRDEFELVKRRVLPMSPQDHDSVHEDDACPCRSGMTYKRCHKPERPREDGSLLDHLLAPYVRATQIEREQQLSSSRTRLR